MPNPSPMFWVVHPEVSERRFRRRFVIPVGDLRSCLSWRKQLSCGWLQSSHAQQVIGRADQVSGELRFGNADKSCFSKTAHRLHPAEDLFNPLTLALADRIAVVARRSSEL